MKNNFVLSIKTFFKIFFSKEFWKYIKDGILNIPNIIANKINNITNKIVRK